MLAVGVHGRYLHAMCLKFLRSSEHRLNRAFELDHQNKHNCGSNPGTHRTESYVDPGLRMVKHLTV